MIIKSIYSLSYGSFDKFKWGGTPQMERYNLFFGWNGSGKTTLSRVLKSFEDDVMLSGDCAIRLENGDLINAGNKIFNRSNIKVFNVDYVENIVKNISGVISPIYTVGKGHADSVDLLNRVKLSIDKLVKIIKKIHKRVDICNKDLEKFLQSKSLKIKDEVRSGFKSRYDR